MGTGPSIWFIGPDGKVQSTAGVERDEIGVYGHLSLNDAIRAETARYEAERAARRSGKPVRLSDAIPSADLGSDPRQGPLPASLQAPLFWSFGRGPSRQAFPAQQAALLCLTFVALLFAAKTLLSRESIP